MSKLWDLIKRHPQTLVSAAGSVLGGLGVLLPSVLSDKTAVKAVFATSVLTLILAQAKPVLDKLFPPDAP